MDIPEQMRILECDKRFILVAGGEQSGKSLTASKFFLKIFPLLEDGDVVWLVAQDYSRTRREFEYIAEDMAKLGFLLKRTDNVDPGQILIKPTAPGNKPIRIETKSAKDPATLAMEAPRLIIGCEASQMTQEAYWRIEGRAGPKNAWVYLSGTFEEGSLGWYPSLYTSWEGGYGDSQSFSLPSTSNKYFYPLGLDDPRIQRIKQNTSDAFFMERIMGKPVPPRGLVLNEFRGDVHVKECPFDPDYPVYIAVDPGYGHAFAVEANQIVEGQVRLFDELYYDNMTVDDIIARLYDNPVEYPWAKNVIAGTIDIGGTQHQAMSSVQEVWERKTGLTLTSNKVKINEGTEQMKRFLKVDPIHNKPKMVISPRCRGILSELGFCTSPLDGQVHPYRWKTDRDGKTIGTEPLDLHNDAVKAEIYWLVDHFGSTTSNPPARAGWRAYA